ncbi:carboxypeptidase B-like [Anneissia japonica]|uniref:carboxypeptidase B-like n=1 Tax=Anneissia japonica TaxID=1529436 RepID=UPI0014257456|nr:carboxypeptidase B-like [Anneissia japonica]
MTRSWAVFVLCLLSVAQGGQYSNYQVIRVVPSTKEHVLQLHALELRQTCHQLDFWMSARTVGKAVDIMVPPTAKSYINLALDTIKAPYHVLINDVDGLIQNQRESRALNVKTDDEDDFFKAYRTIAEIEAWTADLVNKYADVLSEVDLGTSYEGQSMKALKMSPNNKSGKKQIWLEGGIHAREWISPATLMYITNKILEKYASNAVDVIEFLDEYDIYVLFVTNPDGYRYTWTDDRLWRKTRSPNEGSDCIGTDPNRNWPYEWGGEGASTNPCSDTYRGSSAASEPEVKSIVGFLPQLENLKMFIDFHSYSQLILYPWGYSESAPPIPNLEEVHYMADQIASGIYTVDGTEYKIGNSAKLLYPASGGSDDYAYSIGADFSYVIELPDTGTYGFLLPEDMIIPTGEETYTGIIAAFKLLKQTT